MRRWQSSSEAWISPKTSVILAGCGLLLSSLYWEGWFWAAEQMSLFGLVGWLVPATLSTKRKRGLGEKIATSAILGLASGAPCVGMYALIWIKFHEGQPMMPGPLVGVLMGLGLGAIQGGIAGAIAACVVGFLGRRRGYAQDDERNGRTESEP